MARLSRRPRPGSRLGIILGAFALVAVLGVGQAPAPARALNTGEVRILAGAPQTFDPAAAGDVTTAAVTAQLYETLTTYDAARTLQPALAASWDVASDGRRVVFHLRPGLTFSDGLPLTGADVVGSWLRIIDPQHPAPLAALMIDVKGVRDHLTGLETDPANVGISADGNDVTVELERPGADFPAIVSSPLFAVVPAGAWRDDKNVFVAGGAVSGGYVLAQVTDTEITLERNEHYWAGPPAIGTVRLLLDIGGRSPVAAFEAGDLDYTQASSIDAPWLPYDSNLGPQLRESPQLSLTYLGLTTNRPPFDDVRVRQAIGAAVDWNRVVTLGSFVGSIAAQSMVPIGIPGAGDQDWRPVHDPDLARKLLADAGYPGGVGLPTIRFASGSVPLADGIAADLERELGMHVEVESIDDHLTRLVEDPPNLWITAWIADYVGPNDFLGVLLESDSSNNYGHWVSDAFDAAIADALATRDPAAAQAAYERALAEVQQGVPVVPLSLGTDWALSRTGLLGAGSNGLGILRMAGMAWAP